MKRYSGWCDLESHLTEQYFFETLPSTSKKLILYSVNKNFLDSLFFCRKICGRMVLPSNQKESDELNSIAKRFRKYFWIRYSDVEREGHWRDFDNDAIVNFRNWGSGQPRNYNSDYDFAVMYGSDGKLYDVTRSDTYNVVCELPQES